MKSDILLEVDHLNLHFGKNFIFSDLSFDIKRGDFVCLLGPSGVGKSVLLNLIIGLLKPTSGHISLKFSGHQEISIGMAFQNPLLFPWLDLVENLVVCQRQKESRIKKKIKAQNWLMNAGLGSFFEYYPSQISLGMMQKVNLIRAMINESELVLMDEPFSSLDDFQRMKLQDFTKKWHTQRGQTTIFVTHNISEALYLADRVLILSGKLRDHIIDDINLQDLKIERDEERAYSSHLQILDLEKRIFKAISPFLRDSI